MTYYHTKGAVMRKTKVAVTLDAKLVQQLDELVAERRFPNRSQAIETAVAEKIERSQRARLAREAAKLDPSEEKGLAEEGLGGDFAAWPEY
jgi:Arc/MetJ-type ribon-helix-helix transcriptional regulator